MATAQKGVNPFAKPAPGKAMPSKMMPESKKEDAGHATNLRQVLTNNGVTGTKASKIIADFKKTE